MSALDQLPPKPKVFKGYMDVRAFPSAMCVVSGEMTFKKSKDDPEEVKMGFFWFDNAETLEYTRKQAVHLSQQHDMLVYNLDYRATAIFDDDTPLEFWVH